MSEQIILTLHRLVKRYPPDKVVLDGITLSFLHGAKIGVLGANGSGKSSLLRIMAGIDTRFDGDAQLAPGATVGMLEQEPHLDETRTVYENVEDGMRETRDLLDRFNAIRRSSASRSTPTRWSGRSPRWARCRRRSTRSTAGTSSACSRRRWTPCACHPARPR